MRSVSSSNYVRQTHQNRDGNWSIDVHPLRVIEYSAADRAEAVVKPVLLVDRGFLDTPNNRTPRQYLFAKVIFGGFIFSQEQYQFVPPLFPLQRLNNVFCGDSAVVSS